MLKTNDKTSTSFFLVLAMISGALNSTERAEASPSKNALSTCIAEVANDFSKLALISEKDQRTWENLLNQFSPATQNALTGNDSQLLNECIQFKHTRAELSTRPYVLNELNITFEMKRFISKVTSKCPIGIYFQSQIKTSALMKLTKGILEVKGYLPEVIHTMNLFGDTLTMGKNPNLALAVYPRCSRASSTSTGRSCGLKLRMLDTRYAGTQERFVGDWLGNWHGETLFENKIHKLSTSVGKPLPFREFKKIEDVKALVESLPACAALK